MKYIPQYQVDICYNNGNMCVTNTIRRCNRIMKYDKIDYTYYEMEYSILPRMYYEYEESDSFLNQILEDELILKIYEK